MIATPGGGAQKRRQPAGFQSAMALFLLAVLAGCAASRQEVPAGEAEQVAYARQLVEGGDNRDAVTTLTAFILEHPGSRYVDEAIFLLGRAHYELGSYFEAEDQFRKIRRDFPESQFYCESLYHLGLALLSQARSPELDQSERHAAIVELKSFLDQCPESLNLERAREHILTARTVLAEKEMKNGRTYTRVGSHKAARHHFQKVVEDFPETEWVPAAMLSLAKSYEKKKEWKEAILWANRLLAEYPESEEAMEAASILERAREQGPAPEAEKAPASAEPDSMNHVGGNY